MQPEVRAALFEWLAGATIGALPLLAHIGAALFAPEGGGGGKWVVDFIFWGIAACGASATGSLFHRFSGTEVKSSAKAATAICVAILSLEAVLYGIVVSDQNTPWAIFGAAGLLMGSFAAAMYVEVCLAEAKSKSLHGAAPPSAAIAVTEKAPEPSSKAESAPTPPAPPLDKQSPPADRP
jgi:hypothetical protein